MSNDTDSKRPRLLDLAGCEDYTGIPYRTWQEWVTTERVPFARPAGKGGKAYISTEYLDRLMENAAVKADERDARAAAEMDRRLRISNEMTLESIEERQARETRESWAEDDGQPVETAEERHAKGKRYLTEASNRQAAAERRAREQGWS